jgi:hypothetical protein
MLFRLGDLFVNDSQKYPHLTHNNGDAALEHRLASFKTLPGLSREPLRLLDLFKCETK